jgi:hypothetical protein
MIIGIIYRPHHVDPGWQSTLAENVRDILLQYPRDRSCLCGDFNVDYNTPVLTNRKYIEKFQNLQLTQIIDKVTRVGVGSTGKATATTIDQLWVDGSLAPHSSLLKCCDVNSDHHGLLVEIQTPVEEGGRNHSTGEEHA